MFSLKLSILLCGIAYVAADVRVLTDRNLDLFKYDPSDVYTLPEDIDDDKPAVIFNGDVMKAKVEKLQNLNGNKKFKLDLKTQNGIEVTSVGKLRDDKTFVVSGSYSFTGADGKRYKTRYTADEFGYHPITELDLDIPEPQPVAAASTTFNNKFNGLERPSNGNPNDNGLKNRYEFLNQNLENVYLPIRGSGQSGDDYSYNNAQKNKFSNAENNNNYNTNYNYNSYDKLNTDNTNNLGTDHAYNTDSTNDNIYTYGNGEVGSGINGYDYKAPSVQFNNPETPSRHYLPAL